LEDSQVAVWEIVAQGQALRQARRPFALATVVRCERPASARPGDQALITEDGHLQGWIGGSCTEPVIVREALRALRTGRGCLVRLGPPHAQPGVTPEGVTVYPMTCHSGGTLEIFVDPCLPTPQAVLVGHAPVVETLAMVAAAAGFDVVVCAPQAAAERFPTAKQVVPALDHVAASLDPRTYVVVATHGEADEEALAVALRSRAGYVALVSSPRRAEACLQDLLGRGLTREQVARLKAPAGLDLGATSPAHIAVSIVAEMVQRHCSTVPAWGKDAGVGDTPDRPEGPIAGAATAVDPVCGMTVEIGEGTPTLVHEGQVYYFCCRSCHGRFQREPARFLVGAPAGSQS
jgi:xanthine dehydrogenase accessory factor